MRDDTGREYEVQNLAQQAGLGALQTAVWIEPAPPPDARRLMLEVTGLVRTAVARGTGIERPLSGTVWSFEIDLVPQRTAAPVPDAPTAAAPDRAPGAGPGADLRRASATCSRSARRGSQTGSPSASGRSSATPTAPC